MGRMAFKGVEDVSSNSGSPKMNARGGTHLNQGQGRLTLDNHGPWKGRF